MRIMHRCQWPSTFPPWPCFRLDEKESLQIYEQALNLAREILGSEARVTGLLQLNYAQVLQSLNRTTEAKAMKHEGADVYRRASLRDDRTIDVELLRNAR